MKRVYTLNDAPMIFKLEWPANGLVGYYVDSDDALADGAPVSDVEGETAIADWVTMGHYEKGTAKHPTSAQSGDFVLASDVDNVSETGMETGTHFSPALKALLFDDKTIIVDEDETGRICSL